MAILSYFFNAIKNGDTYDRVYQAQDFTNYLDKLVGSGVFANPSTSLQVVSSSGMGIIVHPGTAWINGHKINNTTDYNLTLEQSDVVLNRIDRVVVYVDYTTRTCGIKIKKGTSAVTPTAPNIIRNDTMIEYCLAEIKINKQVSAITQSAITDTRPNNKVCGWVTSLITQVDTSTLFDQWQQAYKEQIEANQKKYDDWLNGIKNDIHKQIPVKILKRNYVSTANQTTITIPSDLSYNIDKDTLDVYINGFKLKNNEYSNTATKITLVNKLLAGNDIEINIIRSIE